MNVLFKNTDLAIKDVDLTKRTVVGYFSQFGSKDSDGDVIVKGAFKKTIQENKERIAHLLQHNINQPIGKIVALEEDANGLKFESVLSKSTLGNDTLIQYQEGILREHSIGFNIIKDEKKSDYNEIQEVKLWEGSTVTFGANPNTPVIGIKSEAEKEVEAVKQLQALKNFMRKGSVSDESFRLIEFEISRIKDILTLKFNQEPQPHSEKLEPSFSLEKFNKFLEN